MKLRLRVCESRERPLNDIFDNLSAREVRASEKWSEGGEGKELSNERFCALYSREKKSLSVSK